VLLVATREVTTTYLDTFRMAVDIVEINSFALIRTIRDQLRQFTPQEAAVLVDIEFDNTEIAIIVDGVPQFSRTVPIGTYQLQSALLQPTYLHLGTCGCGQQTISTTTDKGGRNAQVLIRYGSDNQSFGRAN